MDRRRPSRFGFTLVELLMVVVIIGILIGLLVPTLAAAFRRAKEASVTAEISNLAAALAAFKNQYGDYPPSRIILCETGYSTNPTVNPNAGALYSTAAVAGLDSNDTDMSYAQLTQRSLLYLRKFWPRADFNATADYNNDHHVSGYHFLSGSECLTFFLGGIPINNIDGTTITQVTDPGFQITGVSGFSKSPTNPFANVANSTNRTVPNYEFNTGRLIDQDIDGFPSYIDPIDTSIGSQRAYAYFSSYGTNGYDPNDVNGNGHTVTGGNAVVVPELEDDGATDVERGFLVNFPTSSTGPPYSAISPGPNPYTSGQPATGTVSWINPNSFQLFSAGQDRYWGLGGMYTPNAGAGGKLPILPNPADPGNIHHDEYPPPAPPATSVRLRESDNLTNFAAGRLD